MFEQSKLCTEVYRSELALRLRALGYRLRNTANGFEIEGVQPEIIERFSKRRRTVLSVDALLAVASGTPLSNNQRAAISRLTRPAKRADLTPEQVLAHQRAQLSDQEFAELDQLAKASLAAASAAQAAAPRLQLSESEAVNLKNLSQISGPPEARPAAQAPSPDAHQPTDVAETNRLDHGREKVEPSEAATQGRAQPRLPVDPQAARAAIDYARDHLFERSSAVPRHELLRHALQFGRGSVDLAMLETELQRRTEFICVDGTLTTKETLRLEQRMIALVNQGLGGCHPLRADYRPTGALEPEQEQALQLILRSPDEVIALQGRAGAGKTQLLQELVRAIDQRYASTVLAPAAAAVDVLRPQGFKQAATVQSFLVDPEFQRSTRGQALVVDEAGVLSLHDLHRTHSRAEERPFGLRGHDSTATRV